MLPLNRGTFVASSGLLENAPILSSLPFVEEGRTYALAHDTWTNPGTVGVKVLVTRAVDALTGSTREG